MARRLYRNVNDRFRTSNLGRVTYPQLQRAGYTRDDRVDLNYTPPGLEEEVKNDHLKRLLKEVKRVRHLMDERTDKRRRPPGVSKAAFKMYRKLKLKPPTKKKPAARK